MKDPNQDVRFRYSLGERILVLLIALAAFAYFLYRVFEPWDPWPEETLWPRIGEAIFVGLFLLWAASFVFWPCISGGQPAPSAEIGPPSRDPTTGVESCETDPPSPRPS